MDIALRHEEPDDYEAVWEIYRCPGVIWGTCQMPFPSKELWKNRLATASEHRTGLLAETDGRVIGHLGLFRKTNSPRMMHAGSLGIGVHDEFQGRGVGSALFEEAIRIADQWMGLLRLELTVYVDNPSAIHLYQKFGFEIEGCLRASALREGRYVDAYTMARLHPNSPSLANCITPESITPAS